MDGGDPAGGVGLPPLHRQVVPEAPPPALPTLPLPLPLPLHPAQPSVGWPARCGGGGGRGGVVERGGRVGDGVGRGGAGRRRRGDDVVAGFGRLADEVDKMRGDVLAPLEAQSDHAACIASHESLRQAAAMRGWAVVNGDWGEVMVIKE